MDSIICKKCGNKIDNTNDMFSISGIGKVHIECWRKRLLEKYKNNTQKVHTEMEKLIEKKRKKELKDIDKEKEEQIKKQHGLDRSKFFDYIIETYDISLPKYTITKISNINNGTQEGLKEGISYEDLLYMFKSKQKDLINIYQNNIKKGNSFRDNVQRFHYDLAVIVGKYDSYKKWKEKQKLNEIEQDNSKTQIEEQSKQKEVFQNIYNTQQGEKQSKQNKVNTESKYSLEDMVDELYSDDED